MRDKPAGIGKGELRLALAGGWHIHVSSMRYAPVGGGSYHWVVRDAQGGQWFATVDDLGDKGWLGNTEAAVFKGLRVAMDTALALRRLAGLRFVVAPIPSLHGDTVLPLGPRHAVAVFPFIHGASGRFGEELSPAERCHLVDMLAALHRSTPTASKAAPGQVALPRRGVLEAALNELGRPWQGGPFSEPARALLTSAAEHVRHLLKAFDQLAEHVTAAPEPVITHGEPHAANVIRAGADWMLIDWDTVALAPPERDLWMVISDTGEQSRRYTKATGRAVDPAALAFYRIRWALDDISAFVHHFRTRHDRTAETEHMWLSLYANRMRSTPRSIEGVSA